MTPVQSHALQFIREYWADNICSPSFQEIGDKLGIRSKSRVWDIVHALQDRGYITTRYGAPRSIKPVVYNCPYCGRSLE